MAGAKTRLSRRREQGAQDTVNAVASCASRRHYVTRCYDSAVRRFALTIVVVLLTVSASDVSRLIIAEPCGVGVEERGQHDGACPPSA